MTLSPEERSRALLEALKGIRWPSENEAIPLIATAIRHACNEKLEEVRDRLAKSEIDGIALWTAASILNDLKSEDPIP